MSHHHWHRGRHHGLKLAKEYKVKVATHKGPGSYNFLGLVGFDK
ncbi:MAG: hypothetical protein O3C34_05710 [Proteobacteria bacterium]|nr:hypothetical protein [Pseudomonadota bacterium]